MILHGVRFLRIAILNEFCVFCVALSGFEITAVRFLKSAIFVSWDLDLRIGPIVGAGLSAFSSRGRLIARVRQDGPPEQTGQHRDSGSQW